ncbi:MAG: threonine/serine exporter family protein [Clostridia bacterium]
MSIFSHYFFSAVVSLVATMSFSVILNLPKKQIVYAGIVGMIGWIIFIILNENFLDSVFASFYATLGLALVARIFSYLRKSPVTMYLIPGIFSLVPGAGIYATGYSMFMGSTVEALTLGVETFQIAVAIALGMGLVLSLPNVLFYPIRRINEKNN